MDVVIKSFVGLFFLMLISVTGIGFIGASIHSKNADGFLSYAVDRIENSDYAESVINDCVEEASGQGYSLQVSVFGTTEKYGSASLQYSYFIPMLGIKESKVLVSAMC